jgi:hypothetical protein
MPAPNPNKPEDASGTFVVPPGDLSESQVFPLEITLSGKMKTIELPDDSEILLSPGLKATLTNLDDPSHSVTLNITGSFHQTTLQDGSIVTEYNGRNLLADDFIDNNQPGLVLAIGHFVDNDGDLLPVEGQGQIVDVIDLLI